MGPGEAGSASAGYEALTTAQLSVLEQVAFVRLLPEAVRALVCHLFAPVVLGAGEVLIEEGTPADALFVVSGGELEVVKAAGRDRGRSRPRPGRTGGRRGGPARGPAPHGDRTGRPVRAG